MKKIQLSNNGRINKGKYFAMVDDEDYDQLSKYKWHVSRDHNTHYAKSKTGKTHILMHRLILGLTDRKIEIDHIDHNGLNCQKANMRTCNTLQNQYNRRPYSISGYKGVREKVKNGRVRWEGHIQVEGKSYHLGNFYCPDLAAWAYDFVAMELFGEFAYLNLDY